MRVRSTACLLVVLATPAWAGTDPRGDAPSWIWSDTGVADRWPDVVLADTNGDGIQDVIVADPIVDPAHRELDDPSRLLIFFGGPTLSATPDVVFDASSDVPTSALGAWGDLDGDGDDDFVTWSAGLEEGSRDLWVRWGGPGGPGAAQPLPIRDYYQPTGFDLKLPVGRILDVNGDGFGDVLFRQTGGATRAGQSYFSLHLGRATGMDRLETWSLAFDWSGLVQTELAIIGDLDGDGFRELAALSVLDLDDARICELDVYRGGAKGPQDGLWSSQLVGALASPADLRAVDAGDLDGDGRADVVLSLTPRLPGAASRVLTFHGDVDYGFRLSDPEVSWRDADGADVRVLGSGDFDGDGKPDLVIGLPDTTSSGSGATGSATLGLASDDWFFRGAGLTFAAVDADRGLGARGAVGDISGDGLADVLLVAPGTVDGAAATLQRFLGFADHDLDHSDDDVDCLPDDATVHPGATEVWYDGLDQDCDGNDADQDLDGELAPDDCDDLDPTRNTLAAEVWYDGVDQDCDGDDVDQDGDGAAAITGGGKDCDDLDPSVGPFADDIPGNGIDEDCSGDDATDISPPSCGCATSGTPGVGAALLLLAAFTRRRRRA